jgi:signal peptidase II
MGRRSILEVRLKKLVRSYLVLFLLAGSIVALDQWTKWLVRTNLAIGDVWNPWPWLAPYARIVHWYNTGVAFGMFQGMGMIFMVLAIIVSIAIIFYYPRVAAEDWLLRLAMGFQLAGAMGNLLDRIFNNGNVTDFISVGSFAVFNVADSSITIGVAILLLGVYLQERRQKTQTAENVEKQNPDPQDTGQNPPLDQQMS